MEALFIVVAELLIIPLILWALIVLELTLGVAASVFAIMVGRRSLGEAIRFSWRAIRRRLIWSAICLGAALLLADLVFFETIVNLALRSVDEREQLDVSCGRAEGSFILGRIELHELALDGVRGGSEDPSARFGVFVDELIIDVDTAKLLSAAFAVEELSLDGVRGSFDRLRASPPKLERDQQDAPAREFTVERMHFGNIAIALRDHTGEQPRELELELAELDIGPVASDSVVFDLLYRSRGRGSIAGHEFSLTSVETERGPQTTLEVHDLPLDALAEPLEQAAKVSASGRAELMVVNRYVEGPSEPQIEIGVAMRLLALELEAGADASPGTRVMLQMASRQLSKYAGDFPLEFQINVLRSELAMARSLAESGVLERVSDAIVDALREQLSKGPPEQPGPEQPGPEQP